MVTSALLLLAGGVVLTVAVPRGLRSRGRSSVSAPFELHVGGRRNVVLSTVACILLLAWLIVWNQSSVQPVSDWLAVDASAAGRLVGVFGIGASVAAFAVPMAIDRFGRRLSLACTALLGGAGGLAVGVVAAADVVPPAGLATVGLFLSWVAMGGLPLVISIIRVASGDVGRALVAPIAGSEVVGAAVLPILAAPAIPLGLPLVVALAATAVLGLVAISALLGCARPRRRQPQISWAVSTMSASFATCSS